MNLELTILKPEKLSTSDNFIISTIMMQDGPDKDNEDYDSLMEKSYAVDPDEIDLFEDYPKSIYFHSGWWVKANIMHKAIVPCNEIMEFDDSNLPSMTMSRICQRFVDSYYTCDKFFWKSSEFIDFFDTIVSLDPNWGDDEIEVINQITDEIVKKLSGDSIFVHFSLT